MLRPLLSVLARYPQISETFVEGELRELVARGVPVEAVALAPGHPDPERPAGGLRGLPRPTTPRASASRAALRVAREHPGDTASYLQRASAPGRRRAGGGGCAGWRASRPGCRWRAAPATCTPTSPPSPRTSRGCSRASPGAPTASPATPTTSSSGAGGAPREPRRRQVHGHRLRVQPPPHRERRARARAQGVRAHPRHGPRALPAREPLRGRRAGGGRRAAGAEEGLLGPDRRGGPARGSGSTDARS